MLRLALFLALAASASAQPALDGFVSVERPYATLYAVDADALHDAIEEVSFAAVQFEQAFGEPPPSIRVVVADDRDALTDLPPDPDGRKTLPFWTRRGFSSQSTGAVLAAGALLQAVDGALRVAGVLQDGEGPLRTGDEVVAVADQAVTSLAAWQREIGRAQGGSTVDVTVRRDGTEQTVAVPVDAPHPQARVARPASMSARPLSHEAGHLFLAQYAAARGSGPFEKDTTRAYSGVPALPDWMDEAFATWCEVPALARQREALLARELDDAIPFDSLLSMEHPILATRVLDNFESDGAPVRLQVTGRELGVLRRGPLFYAQSLSLVRFLAATHGPRVFGRLVDRVLDGATMDEALAAEGVEAGPLEADWRAWTAATVADAGAR